MRLDSCGKGPIPAALPVTEGSPEQQVLRGGAVGGATRLPGAWAGLPGFVAGPSIAHPWVNGGPTPGYFLEEETPRTRTAPGLVEELFMEPAQL